jgi:hypothetical protein
MLKLFKSRIAFEDECENEWGGAGTGSSCQLPGSFGPNIITSLLWGMLTDFKGCCIDMYILLVVYEGLMRFKLKQRQIEQFVHRCKETSTVHRGIQGSPWSNRFNRKL